MKVGGQIHTVVALPWREGGITPGFHFLRSFYKADWKIFVCCSGVCVIHFLNFLSLSRRSAIHSLRNWLKEDLLFVYQPTIWYHNTVPRLKGKIFTLFLLKQPVIVLLRVLKSSRSNLGQDVDCLVIYFFSTFVRPENRLNSTSRLDTALPHSVHCQSAVRCCVVWITESGVKQAISTHSEGWRPSVTTKFYVVLFYNFIVWSKVQKTVIKRN
jgi:hypothetical protein